MIRFERCREHNGAWIPHAPDLPNAGAELRREQSQVGEETTALTGDRPCVGPTVSGAPSTHEMSAAIPAGKDEYAILHAASMAPDDECYKCGGASCRGVELQLVALCADCLRAKI